MNSSRMRRRLVFVGSLAAGGVLLLAGPSAAHVSVDPETAEKGGYATLDFKVPNERDNASTVKLEVTLPSDFPLTSVMPEPVPGWDVKVTESKLDEPIESHGEQITEAPSKITWTGGKVEPGTFQRFPVSVGQLSEEADRLVFKAVQTYDSGEIVRWIEVPEEGGEEPEHPAPVLALTAPAEEDGDAAEPAGAETDGKQAASTDGAGAGSDTAAADGDSSDTLARTLGIVGVVLGAGGVAFGVLAGRRRAG